MLLGELRWLMNEQVLWPGGTCVMLGEQRFALGTRLYKHPPLPLPLQTQSFKGRSHPTSPQIYCQREGSARA